MSDLFAAAQAIDDLCRSKEWGHCLIGGMAVLRWGEPRQTRDVDLTILTGYGNESDVVDTLLAHFGERTDEAREFALRHRVVLLHSDEGVGIDVALGAMPFEQRAVARATDWELAQDLVLRTCSAEDLVVHKAFAGRAQDWIDIEMVLTRQGASLDRDLIREEALPLLEVKDAVEDRQRLLALLDVEPGFGHA